MSGVEEYNSARSCSKLEMRLSIIGVHLSESN